MVKEGYKFDLFTNKLVNNSKNLFNRTFSLEEFEKLKSNYKIIISTKALIESDITYIHDHSYLYRQKMMSNPISHFFYKIFNRKKHLKRLKEFEDVKSKICKIKKVIVSSEILKQDMIENYGVNPEQIVILPPPIEKYDFRERSSNDIFTFGISAVGFERKGGYLTLKVIRELKKQGYKFKVKFIYPSKNYWVNLLIKLYGIKGYCEILPLYKDMSEFYYSIDCLLMPSLIEPFGMVATEALSTGCPVVTGLHCGSSDVIKNSENGFLYEGNKSYKNLAKAMIKAIEQIPQNKEYFKNNCLKSVENQTLEKFCSKYIDLLKF